MPVQKITKEEIMTRSLNVFLQQGYHKTTMDDLAKACGVFKGSFYYYFASKEALMKSILENSINFVEKHVFAVAYDTTLSPYERLKNLFQAQEQLLLGFNGGCIFGNTAFETALVVPEFQENIHLFFEKWEEALVAIFNNKMTLSEAQQKALETMILVEGALLFVKVKRENHYLTDVYQRILSEFREK